MSPFVTALRNEAAALLRQWEELEIDLRQGMTPAEEIVGAMRDNEVRAAAVAHCLHTYELKIY